MKKRLIASAIVLATIVIAPKIVSSKVEESLHATIAEINSIPGYIAQVQEFKSGWFASTAKIEIGVDLAAMSPQVNPDDYPFPTEGSVLVDFNSSHGPILFGAHSGIGWFGYTISYSGESARNALSWADSTALYTLTGNMGLFGNSQFSDSIPAFKAAEDQPYNVDFSGYQGQGKYSSGEYIYSGVSEKLNVDDTEGNFIITGISYDISMQGSILEALQGVAFDSEINFGVNNIAFDGASGGEQLFAIKELTLGAVTSIDKEANLASGVINYAIKAIDVANYNSSDIVLQMEMNNLSLEFLESYRIFAREMVDLPAEEFGENALDFMQHKFLPALTSSPELNISDFHGTIPEGNFKATMFTKLTGIEAMPDDIMDPAFWLQHILANADIEVDKAVVLMLAQQQLRSQLMQNPEVASMSPEELDQIVIQQTPMMLSTFQQQRLITETDTGYTSSFELKDGKALLNGNPIPIPGM
ncbi:MAG: hypothetical protein ACI88A_001591 [Paraglaciecola sp.]|jgi:hypothetical protein